LKWGGGCGKTLGQRKGQALAKAIARVHSCAGRGKALAEQGWRHAQTYKKQEH